MKTLLAIDQGTTGTTALLINERLEVVAEASVDFDQHFPTPGWVEHDPAQVWQSVELAVNRALGRFDAKNIVAIGITNQRETVCFWDKNTGQSLTRAIVWQDRRTADICEALRSRGLESVFQKRTGLLLDPYFSGTKVAWAIQNVEAVANAEKSGSLAVGTIDSFLLHRLTGGRVHATEPSNASRTLAFDIHKLQFDAELCAHLGFKSEIWPEVKPSMGTFGVTQGLKCLPDGIPITGILGDQQSALLGQACLDEGSAKTTYGTGAFVLLNTGSKPVISTHRLLSTVAWAPTLEKPTYALEGSTFMAGAVVQWLRDGLGIIKSAAEIEALAASVPDNGGVCFVPAFTGLGAPHWNPHATACISGLTRGSTRAHIARAALEGIALQIADVLLAMEKDHGGLLKSLNVDGGASSNNLLMQFQADILGVELRRPKYLETTSMGAVFAAGIGAGVWSSLDSIRSTWQLDRVFKPEMSKESRAQVMASWRASVSHVLQ
jgi:glycerol kinase